MLDFWYSERCSREIKLIMCISTCVIIFLSSKVAALSPLLTGFSLAVGMLIHLLKRLAIKTQPNHPYKSGVQIIIFVTILTAIISLLINLAHQNFWALAIQCLGFIALGLFIVSIYSSRAPRFE